MWGVWRWKRMCDGECVQAEGRDVEDLRVFAQLV